MSGIGLFGENEGREYLRAKIDSGRWWVIVNGHHLNEVVEDRYYHDGEGFEVMLGGPPFITVAFARKDRMSAEQLAACITEAGGNADETQLAAELAKQDILFPGDTAEDLLAATATLGHMYGADWAEDS